MTIPNSFTIDQPWQKKMPADSRKLTPKKRILWGKLAFFKSIYPPENDVTDKEKPHLTAFVFPLLFKIIFFKNLILSIFGISDPLERVIKIIIKVVLCIYTGSVLSLYQFWWWYGLHGAQEGQKQYKQNTFLAFFYFLTPWFGPE